MPKKIKVSEAVENYSYDLAKGVLGSIPAFGFVAAYIFGELVAHPIESRRNAWMEDIAARVNNIEQNHQGFISGLKNNPEFLDVLYQASNIAIKNSQEVKLESLKNAVINSALDDSLEYSVKQIFLRIIDELTPFHFSILRFIDDPDHYYTQNHIERKVYLSSSFKTVIYDALPQLQKEEELLNIVITDLFRMGLQTDNGLYSARGGLTSRTTHLGRKFLSFISLND